MNLTTFPDSEEPPVTVVLGLPFHNTTLEQTLDDCDRYMSSNRCHYVVTPNLDITRLASLDPKLRHILFAADRSLCDGMPLVELSRRQNMPLPERVAGSDLTPRLLELCAKSGRSVYFFGSDESTLEKAASVLAERHPGLKIAGWASPPLAPMEEWDNETFVKDIREAQPDLLLVALGCPKQEYWISRFQRSCRVPLALGIGASLDFIAGKQVRAPRLLQKVGLEWFWRFASSPRRLGGRYAADAAFLLKHFRRVKPAGHQLMMLPETRVPANGGDRSCDRVTDCGSVVRVTADFLSVLATRWRTARAAGEGMRLQRVSAGVARELEYFGWHELMTAQPTDQFVEPTPAEAREGGQAVAAARSAS